jgi:hypothetical protein
VFDSAVQPNSLHISGQEALQPLAAGDPPGTGIGLGFVELRSGTSARPVPQSDLRIFEIMLSA